MKTLPQSEPAEEIESKRRVTATIGRNVMAILGRPPDLFLLAVRPLWENRYRVNVLTGSDVISARISSSFFVFADPDGNIISSQPTVTRQYGAFEMPLPV